MTGDLTVTPRPVMVERGPSAPAAPPGSKAVGAPAGASASEPQPTIASAEPRALEPGATRLKALLTDPSVRVMAHRDDESARMVLRVLDRTTGEVIEQYPPDQLLRFYAALRESLGALVDQRA